MNCMMSIQQYCSYGMVERVKTILQQRPGVVYYQDLEGNTLLHHACKNGQEEFLQVLNRSSLCTWEQSGHLYRTHKILEPKHLEITKLLLSAGCYIESLNYERLNCLYYACHSEYLSTVELLVSRGANVNIVVYREPMFYYPVKHLVTQVKDEEIVEVLLKVNAVCDKPYGYIIDDEYMIEHKDEKIYNLWRKQLIEYLVDLNALLSEKYTGPEVSWYICSRLRGDHSDANVWEVVTEQSELSDAPFTSFSTIYC